MLLNKYNFLPRLFAAGKRSEYTDLKGIFIDTARFLTVATDRYSLLMVKAPKDPIAADFPLIDGHEVNGDQQQADSHIMPTESAEQIEKNLKKIKANDVLKILGYAAPLKVKMENGAGYVTTSLDQSQPVIYRKLSDSFPSWEKILPPEDRQAVASVTLDPEYLEKMGNAFKQAGVTAVNVQFYGENEPVKFSAVCGEDQKIIGVIMPIKS